MIPIPREDIIILMQGGYIYLRMGKFKEAQEVFEGASVLAPESDVPLVALGSVSFAQHKFDRAIRCYQKALALRPDSAFARASLGEALFFKGKKEEAFRELEKASLLDSEGGSGGDFARVLLKEAQKGFAPPGQIGHH